MRVRIAGLMRVAMIALAALCVALSGEAQRKITPVKTDDKKPRQPSLHYYDKHGNPLEKPVRFLTELDSVTTVKAGPAYPLLTNLTVGANFFDGILMAAGQKYGSFDVWADLGLWNWLYPTVEAGIGFASSKPDGRNFTYKSYPSFYAKVGFNYNFLYKSSPDYMFFVGFRCGFSRFSYDISNVDISSGYWEQHQTFSLPRQTASAVYGEGLIGLRVKLIKGLSMGWTARFHGKFNKPKGSQSTPWFIPGYGASSVIAGSFSISYTIPLGKPRVVETDGTIAPVAAPRSDAGGGSETATDSVAPPDPLDLDIKHQ